MSASGGVNSRKFAKIRDRRFGTDAHCDVTTHRACRNQKWRELTPSEENRVVNALSSRLARTTNDLSMGVRSTTYGDPWLSARLEVTGLASAVSECAPVRSFC